MRSESNKLPYFLLGAFLFGIYCFVLGQSGILERVRIEREKESLVHEIARLERDNGRLEALYNEYSNGSFIVSESGNAGLVMPGSRILHFNRSAAVDTASKVQIEKKDISVVGFPVDYLRIAWIILSVAIISIYVLYNNRVKRAGDTGSDEVS